MHFLKPINKGEFLMENKEEPKMKINIDLEKNIEYEIDINEFKRLLAFLFILQDDMFELQELHPAYILEKYIRYIKHPAVKDEYLWGLHPLLMRRFEAYCAKYNIPHDNKGVDNE